MDLWIYAFMDLWIYGFMDLWIYGFMDLWIKINNRVISYILTKIYEIINNRDLITVFQYRINVYCIV
jgi:hypothetical protein